ncbi:MAG: peroxidase family protein, partial [Bdellovibrionota bacterium]
EKGTIGGLSVLKKIREGLLKNSLHDPHLAYNAHEPIDCTKRNTTHRSADGTCTVLEAPHVGAAGTAFSRNVPPRFIDPNAGDRLLTPNPAVISKEFFTRDEFKPVPFLNMLAAVWIQFQNHDWLTHGRNEERDPHRIRVPGENDRIVDRTKENTLSPGQYKREFGKTTLNEVTHWWDASQIYGSNQTEQNNVRSFAFGRLKTEKVGNRELLPRDHTFSPLNNVQNKGHEITGFRDNWWMGLSMLHTLFVKEHNAIASMLFRKHVIDRGDKTYTWKNGGEQVRMNAQQLDEKIFQTARLINAAVLAKIHTVEWTPAILPNPTLKKAMFTNWYGLANPQTWSKFLKRIPILGKTDWFSDSNSGYVIGGIVGDKANNHGVPYGISEEFTSVYRLHSLLPEKLNIRSLANKKQVNAIAFADTRNEKAYPIMASHDLKDLYYSFGTQLPGQLVLNNFPKFMQELTIPGRPTMDLGMVDILRDRERGVPRYNQFRRGIGLKPISSYRDFFPANKVLDARQEKILGKFYAVYGRDANGKDNVESIDLLVGTLAEEVRPKHFGFGETQFQIFILMASRRLMTDRFYTDNFKKEYYTQSGLDWIDNKGLFAQVIVRHMPELEPHVKGLETAFNPWKP